MRLVELRLGDAQSALVTIEQRHNDKWIVVEATVVRTGESEPRTLLVEHDQRLIVESPSSSTLIYDQEQMGVRPAGPATDDELEAIARAIVGPPPGPLPPGPESQVGVWREGGEQLWSRTGAKYRNYRED